MPVTLKAAGETATLTLHGDVGWEITPQGVAAALKEAGGRKLVVSLNTYGGDAFAGFAIHNMLARHPATKTVVIEGVAASAGSIIAMAGDAIVMPDNAFMMIHPAQGFASGGADIARHLADLLDNISDAARRIYAQRTGLPEDEIGALMAAETWFTAEQAKAKGFATEVAAPAEIRLDARRLSALPNLPAALAALTRSAPPAQLKDTSMPPDPATVDQPAIVPATPAAPAPAALAAPQPAAPPAPQAPAAPQPATMEQIEAIAGRARLGSDFVLAQLKAKATADQARDAALDALAAQGPQLQGDGRVILVRDEGDTRRTLMAEAIAHMADPGRNKLSAGARQYRGKNLVQLAEICLATAGIRTQGLTPHEIAELALSPGASGYRMAGEHSSSDFTNILANVASKALRSAYDQAPKTFMPWTQRMDLPDFKTFTSTNLSAFGALKPVAEGGGINYTSLADSGQTWALARYNGGIALTYVAMVNDDLSAFARLPGLAAAAAARLENDLVYKVLLANGTMTETTGALFNATAQTTAGGHANLYTGSTSDLTVDADGIAAVGTLEKYINNQRAPVAAGPGKGPAMRLRGRYLLVPSTLATAARQLFSAELVAATPNVINVFRSQYEVIVEPALNLGVTIGDTTTSGSDTAYYVVADGIDTVHWGYLRGESGPAISSMADFDSDGMKLKVAHNFGAAAVEWRGMAKSAGA